jgi:hypothetical protein
MDKLREQKLNIGGMDIAIADLAGTIGGGYLVAKYMNWNKPATILGAFAIGHLAHNLTGTKTPMSERVNQSLSVPINNSTTPVGENEVRFSTM